MSIDSNLEPDGAASNDHQQELKEVVLGLHWTPLDEAASRSPADLDAFCVLFDSDDRILEVIHPGHPRSVDGSVIHTGDSRTGASHWDDERIFVFVEALPEAVAKLAFVVLSVTGKPFDAVPGASCHVSDRISEVPYVQVDLTTHCGSAAHTVAVLRRGDAAWKISANDLVDQGGVFAQLKRLVSGAK